MTALTKGGTVFSATQATTLATSAYLPEWCLATGWNHALAESATIREISSGVSRIALLSMEEITSYVAVDIGVHVLHCRRCRG